MNRKIIIQILVIVICFGAAALVLYNGYFKNGSVPDSELAAGVTGQGATAFNPLPFGDDLTGELKRVLSRNGLQYEFFRYPKLDPSEVDIPVVDLVKPVPQSENAP